MSSNSRAGLNEFSLAHNDEFLVSSDYARKTNAFTFAKSKRASYDSQQGSLVVKQPFAY